MEEVDRLGWAAGITFEACGVRLGIRVNDPAIVDRLLPSLPWGWSPAESPVVDYLYSVRLARNRSDARIRDFNLLYSPGGRLVRSTDESKVFDVLKRDLPLAMAALSTERIFVHAGVVGWKGKAIVIPGRTLAGKTSLVAEFIRAGATYYSDEFALLDAKGRVHPYAKPLGMRAPGSIEQESVPVEALNGRPGRKPLPVGLVLVTHYHEGARWRPRRISAGRGVLEMFDNTIPAQFNPDGALAALQPAASSATILKGRRGEAKEVVEAVLSRPPWAS